MRIMKPRVSIRASKIAPFAFLAACSPSAANTDQLSSENVIEGYDDLKFGMSFDEAVSIAGLSQFDPGRIDECMIERPIRGCLLLSRNNFTPYRTIEGVPYTLSLSFNRFDKLTDIQLSFVRSDDQAISGEECLSIHERTVDWLVPEIGAFDEAASTEDQNIRRTEAGHQFAIFNSGANDWLSANFVKFEGGRQIDLVSHFLSGRCEISVNWADDLEIERWELSPTEQADYDRIVGSE